MHMQCPYCGEEMTSGIVQSARRIFFTDKEQKNWLLPDVACKDEVLLTAHNWTRPTCNAHNCTHCRKVIIDYAVKDSPV